MKRTDAGAYAQRYASDAAFAESMDAAASMSDALHIAAEHGYEIEPGDILATAGTGQLTDDDLGQARDGSGGHTTFNDRPGCLRY